MRTQGPEYQYKAATGAAFNDLQARAYATYLEEKLGLDNAVGQPQDIVEVSRPLTAPTHERFTWDDTKAAEKYRLEEARQLINHIVVVRQDTSGNEITTKAFHSVVVRTEEGQKRGYVSEKLVWRSPDLADQVVENAVRELEGWVDRWEQYSDLRDSIDLVKQAVRRAKRKRKAA
jgi:hypothetical protein